MSLPKISIVIPSYNKAQFLEETLNSIVAQKYSNLEVIIQDGKSTDNTLKIIKKYSKKYAFITFESKKDKGQTDAINKGFSKAKGDIYTFINADDVYAKGALGKVAKIFFQNKDLLWLSGKGKVINETGEETAFFATLYKDILLRLNLRILLLIVNYLIQPSVFISKDAYLKYGPFSGHKKYVMEYAMWLKLSKECMPCVLNETLSKFRLHRNSFSLQNASEILKKDYEIAKEHTSNPFVLALHLLHNKIRTLFV